MEGILVSKLDELELTHNLRVYNPEVVVDGLIENHVVHMSIYLLPYSSQDLNSVDINILEDLFNLFRLLGGVHFLYKGSQELDQIWVVIVNTEVQAVKQSQRILFDVVGVFRNNFDDF